MSGYHITNIERGELGEFSKIVEEFSELKDAYHQDSKIMMLIEMADMIGAMELYLKKQHNMTITDLVKFSEITVRAFKSGERTEKSLKVKKVCPEKINGSCPDCENND
jgi:phosphoribosyl-ATP pyrophosphohydrolase